MDVPVSLPSAAIPPGTRPTGNDRLGLGQTAIPVQTARSLNDPEATPNRRPIEERTNQGHDHTPQDDGWTPRSTQEQAAQARLAVELGAFHRQHSEDTATERDGRPLEGGGIEALRRRVELAVRLAGPMEEPRRELNVVI